MPGSGVPVTTGSTPWRETGDTTLAAWRQAIARSIGAGSSPMAAEASDVYAAVTGLSRLACSMAWHETKNFSWHCGTAPAGMPCIPEECRNPWAMTGAGDSGQLGRWRRYSSFAAAARDWVKRLTDPAGPYAGTRTIADLIRVYAPATDGNDETEYVATVCREIDRLPLTGGTSVGNPFRTPAIYELYRDYAGFGLTQAQAQTVGNNKFAGRNGMRPSAIVLHCQEGTTRGSLAYWSTVQASSTVMVQRDASVLRVIPEADSPWTNGDIQRPTAKGQSLINRLGGANPNNVTLSVEMEGYSGDVLADGVIETLCWVCWDWMTRYPIGIADIYRHADINSVTRSQCPGTYYDVVMGRLQAAQQGTAPAPAWPGKPAWLPADIIPALFPEASPQGTRTQAWLRYCGEVGRAPARKQFLLRGTPNELIQFDDGALIDMRGQVVGRAAS
jgi:hypothetical protein